MLAKAATSCLSEKDVKALQFEPHPEGHTLEINPKLAGFKIPYFTIAGKLDPEVYRFRFLQTRPSTGFAAITEEPVKPLRYTQPAGKNCGVYLAPILKKPSWKEVADNTEHAVVITEGELKAACACKMGIPTIGLGGVFNWRSAKAGKDLLPILEKFAWMGRKVYVAFDSDTKTNPMVRIAASRLAYALAMEGAIVYLLDLPENGDGKKQGLDDFIYARGEMQGGRDFIALIEEASDIGPGKELHRLNSEVGFVRSTAEVVELETGTPYAAGVFTEARYKNRLYHEKNEAGTLQRKFAAKEWMAWEHRTEFTKFVYDPSCGNSVTSTGAYNTWYPQRWPLVPSSRGSIKPWQQLFDHVFSSLSAEHKQWVKCWLAYPLQYPGTKLYTAMMVWGHTQGTGKSRIGESMKAIYGQNYTMIKNAHLTANFNEWAEHKQFIVGDEISIGDKRGVSNTLKTLITGDTIRLNVKNRKSYDIDDCINYYFSANHEDAMYLENHDRRFFIAHADVPPIEGTFYKDYMRWLDKEGGAARLFYYLKYEVDCSDFNPKAHAPITAAKIEMMAASLTDVEGWAFDLKADPDKQLAAERVVHDLYTTKELLRIFDGSDFAKLKSHGMAKALNSAGVPKAANGSNHVRIGGVRDTVYIVRNVAKYKRMGPTEITKAYAEERNSTKQPSRVGDSQKFAGGVRLN